MKRSLAIIPARGGSKRIKNKNTIMLGDKPLITWTIEAALKAKAINHVVVSTDCESIADVARSAGADVPFMRPETLGSDESTTTDVLLHAIATLGAENYDTLTLLQPTSPFRSADDIDNAFTLFEEKDADGIISIMKAKHHPLWSNTLPPDWSMESFIPKEYLNKRSQDLPQFYSLNGAIFIYKLKAFIAHHGIFYSDKIYGFEMSETSSIDIDDKFDFWAAEAILRNEDVL